MPRVRAFPIHHPLWKLTAVVLIAGVGVLAAAIVQRMAGIDASSRSIDWTAYDKLFRLRPAQDRRDGPIVLVAIDNRSLKLMADHLQFQWPWPRETYAQLIKAMDAAGAKALVFDATFETPSIYDKEFDDSKAVAEAADAARMPVIFALQARADPRAAAFAIPAKRPRFGAVNVEEDVLRHYHTFFYSVPTLAMSTLMATGEAAAGPAIDAPFLVHYYGPFGSLDRNDAHDPPTHRRVSFADVILPAAGMTGADIEPVDPAIFRGKIVVMGAIAHGLYDQKPTPYPSTYPGVDYQATAIENLMDRIHVNLAPPWLLGLAIVLPCVIAAYATIMLRQTLFKITIPAAVVGLLVAVIVILFRRNPITFLAPTAPLTGLGVSWIFGLTWSYFTEGRQRLFLSRAFSQYVSPAVVDELERNPSSLTLGGRRRTVTILFSDIRSFTTISEKLDAPQIEKFMNTYLGAMTDVVLRGKGTVDKYIGDAVMAFWNAPLDQRDHAECAVRAALGMAACEREIQALLQQVSGEEIYTRIGVATGEVTVGNFGSADKINYTVLGDSVNLASRLEGANKIYGSQILLAEPTALAVKDVILVRKLGLLRVKGKTRGLAVYEGMSILPGTAEQQYRKREYEAAFEQYLLQNWTAAEAILVALLRDHPMDHPAETLLEAVREFQSTPPPGDWDGVYVAHEK